MTVQDTTPSVTFVGTGAQVSFPFTFRADDVTWLSVDYVVNFDQFVLNADQDNNPGGTVEYTVAPPLAQNIVLIRDTANTQELDYTRYDPFDSESHEDALDKLTMQIQDLQYLITSTLTQDFDLLGNVDFSGKSDGSLIYWDAGAMLWQDTGVELLFDPGVSFDTNVLVQVQAGADFTSSLRMRSINEIEFFDATNITSSRIFQSVPDLIIDGQGTTAGVTFTGYSDTRPVWIATELALVTDIPVVISDHTLLTNIGVNTHAQIDTHIADSTIHFTEGSIDHTAISNVGINSHGIIDSHIANALIHFTVGSIDHTVITNIGVNSHLQIDAAITLNAANQVITDAHIADLNIHFGDAPADAQDYVRNNNAWAVASSGLAPGTALGNTLRWDGADWVESSRFQNLEASDRFVFLSAASDVFRIDVDATDTTLTSGNGSDDLYFEAAQVELRSANVLVFRDGANSANIGRIFYNDVQGLRIDTTTGRNIQFLRNLNLSMTIENQHIRIEEPLSILERAAAEFDTVAYGQIWVRNTAPNTLYFTDDDGNDFLIGGTGASTTLQDAYDADPSTFPHILVNALEPLTIQDSVAGAIFRVNDSAGGQIFEVDDTFVEVDGQLRIIDAFPNHGVQTAITVEDNYSTGGAFVGGSLAHIGTITYDNAVSIFGTFAEQATYVAAVGPGFAAYTMMQGLPIFSSGAGFNQIQVIGINMAPVHTRVTAGTSTVTTKTGLSFQPQTRAQVAGAVQTITTQPAVVCRPTFSTVAGSTANLGAITGVLMQNPAVALFQPQAGVETATSIIGLDMEAMAFGGNITKAAVRGNLASASNAYFLQNIGTAHSSFGSSHIYFDDNFGVAWGGTLGTGDFDAWYSWNVAGYLRKFFLLNGDEYRTSNPVNNQILHEYSANEVNFNTTRGFTFGSAGTLGNNFGNFVAPARTTQINGEWSDFLLTQAGNITVNNTMSLIAGWTINAPSISAGTGSVTDAGALNIGGNVGQATVNRFGVRILSNPSGGSGVNAALWVTAGATQLDGNIGFFGTTAIPQETAVPVSAAGIHAALVNYGLIT